MREIATLDWTCAHCGTTETWQLVMADSQEPAEEQQRSEGGHPPPTLDWTCESCGRRETWQLVRA